jgi:cation:H+ antiporter
MNPQSILWLLGGLGVLVAGGSLLVHAASRLAAAFDVPPVVVGLTVVAFGTSAPELAVSLEAAWAGRAPVAMGNVLGSNLFNLLFILGLSAMITPLAVAQQFIRKEVPLLVLAGAGTWAFAANGRIAPLEGVGLLVALLAYTGYAIRLARRESEPVKSEYRREFGIRPGSRLRYAFLTLVGFVALAFGAGWFVSAAADIARSFGVSELAIGLVVVAPGTSLPELITSVTAACKGEKDIAVANVLGSNLFNLLGVLGGTAIAAGGISVPLESLSRDLPLMVLSSIVCLPILLSQRIVDRREGTLLLLGYVAYVVFLLPGTAG